MAYLTEPRPGEVKVNFMPPWNTFDEFVNVTTAFFSQIYNNHTMDENKVSRRDTDYNMFGIRSDLTIPYEVNGDKVFDILVKMPGIYPRAVHSAVQLVATLFYGYGVRDYATRFITSNKTIRNQMRPWQICQHEYYMGMTWVEYCLWIEERGVNQYTAWGVSYINEGHGRMWLKFAYRCVLSLYVMRILWKHYYVHYIVLLSNLREFGIASKYTRYDIVVGDPAYSILSDPFMSFAMVVDIWWNIDYISLALMRVTQFQDFWLYMWGCMYLSRYVWFAYLGLRIMSFVVRWRRWESSFAPLDPGLLAITAYIYGGPVISILGTTQALRIFSLLWSFFLPKAESNQAIEAITGRVLIDNS
ncbi:unnamed protein product [Aphanomyces euteiches]